MGKSRFGLEDDFWGIDPEVYVADRKYTQPISGEGRVLRLDETHPRTFPWRGMHPAMEIDIDQRMYEFASELNPLLDEFWSRVEDHSLTRDIFDRWNQRRLLVIFEREEHNHRVDLMRDYLTALLFERVYKQALGRRKVFFQVRQDRMDDSSIFQQLHQDIHYKRLYEQRFKKRQIAQNYYIPEIHKPNEKKLLHVLKEDYVNESREINEIREFYQIARKTTGMIFDQNIVTALNRANGHLFQTNSIRQVVAVLRSLQARWASLFKNVKAIEEILVPAIKNQSLLLQPALEQVEVGLHPHDRSDHNKLKLSAPKDPVPEVSKQHSIQKYIVASQTEDDVQTETQVQQHSIPFPKQTEESPRTSTAQDYMAYKPNKFTIATREPIGFALPRIQDAASTEQTIKHQKQDIEAIHLQEPLRWKLETSQVESSSEKIKQVLANHDYAWHTQESSQSKDPGTPPEIEKTNDIKVQRSHKTKETS